MIEYSIVAIAVAFVILVIYLIVVLRAAKTTLEQLTKTLVCAKQQLNELSMESVKIIQNTQKISANIEEKIKSLDSLFLLVEEVSGKALNAIDSNEDSISAVGLHETIDDRILTKPITTKTKMDAIIQCVGAGLDLWKKFRKK